MSISLPNLNDQKYTQTFSRPLSLLHSNKHSPSWPAVAQVQGVWFLSPSESWRNACVLDPYGTSLSLQPPPAFKTGYGPPLLFPCDVASRISPTAAWLPMWLLNRPHVKCYSLKNRSLQRPVCCHLLTLILNQPIVPTDQLCRGLKTYTLREEGVFTGPKLGSNAL